MNDLLSNIPPDVDIHAPIYTCRICGMSQYPDMPRGEDGEFANHNICACCGCEFGYHDCLLIPIFTYRQRWLDNGAKWEYPKFKPADWDLGEQLSYIPNEFL